MYKRQVNALARDEVHHSVYGLLVVAHLARPSRLCRGRPRPCSRRLPARGAAVFVFLVKITVPILCVYSYVCIEVASSDDVAFVEGLDPFGRGLDVQFSFLYAARRGLHKTSLASRKERFCRYLVSESKGRYSRGPFAPWLRSGFVFPNVNHYEDHQCWHRWQTS